MPTKESAPKNIDTMHSYLDHISKNLPQIKMVVFPELACADFTKKPIDQAEPIPGEKTKIFSELVSISPFGSSRLKILSLMLYLTALSAEILKGCCFLSRPINKGFFNTCAVELISSLSNVIILLLVPVLCDKPLKIRIVKIVTEKNKKRYLRDLIKCEYFITI